MDARLLNLPAELIVIIAMMHPEVFIALSKTCARFRNILRAVTMPADGCGANVTIYDCVVFRGLFPAMIKMSTSGTHFIYYDNLGHWALEKIMLTDGYRHQYHIKDDLSMKSVYYPNGMLKQKSPTDYYDNAGVHATYWPNGKLRSHVLYQEGAKKGDEMNFYADGTLKIATTWSAFVELGPRRKFRKDGTLESEDQFDQAYRVCSVLYYPDGVTARVRSQHGGPHRAAHNAAVRYNVPLHGNTSSWYPNGKLRETATYSSGKLNGARKVYDEDGNLILTENYCNGRRIA